MKLRPPTPLHGWRVFVGEVGIIVLGVLLALGAQQVVEGFQKRKDVSDLRMALRAELADSRARWEDLQASDKCVIARLDAIERWLAAAGSGSQLSNAFDLRLWNLHSNAWDIAKMSPVAAEIPLKERLIYATYYGALEGWRAIIVNERANSDDLNGLLAAADDPRNRVSARMAIARARVMIQRRQRNYPYFFERLDLLNIRPDFSGINRQLVRNSMCGPLAT